MGRQYHAIASFVVPSLLLVAFPSQALTISSGAKTPTLPASEQAAIFKAAAFVKKGTQWKSDCGDPGTASYEPGAIEAKGDLNGDGLPEAVITEGGTFCYGMTGLGFWLMSKQANGQWKLMHRSIGIPEFLKTKGVGGWPDISIGGPGFCFPVLRWNGKKYIQHRTAYMGKPCRR